MKYKPEFTAAFKREMKKAEARGKDMQKVKTIIDILCDERPLPQIFRDHALKGRFLGYRECHVEPDWLLVYKKIEDRLVLLLTRTGSHADLFGS